MSKGRESFQRGISQEAQPPESSIPLFRRPVSRFDVPRTERQKHRLPAVPMSPEMRAHFENSTQYSFHQPWLGTEVEVSQGPQPFLEIDAERRAAGIELQPAEHFDYEAQLEQVKAFFPTSPRPTSLPESQFLSTESDEEFLAPVEAEERINLAWQLFQALVQTFRNRSASKRRRTT